MKYIFLVLFFVFSSTFVYAEDHDGRGCKPKDIRLCCIINCTDLMEEDPNGPIQVDLNLAPSYKLRPLHSPKIKENIRTDLELFRNLNESYRVELEELRKKEDISIDSYRSPIDDYKGNIKIYSTVTKNLYDE